MRSLVLVALLLAGAVSADTVLYCAGTQVGPVTTIDFTGNACSRVGSKAVLIAADGGASSGVGTCSAHAFETADNNGAAPTCAQPSFTDISGTAADGQLANAYSGVGTCTNQFPRTLTRNAAPTCASVSLTADVTGILPGANGGLGAAQPTCAANQRLTCDGSTCTCSTTAAANTYEITVDFGTASSDYSNTFAVGWIVTTSIVTCSPSLKAIDVRAAGTEDVIIEQITWGAWVVDNGILGFKAHVPLGTASGLFLFHCVGA